MAEAIAPASPAAAPKGLLARVVGVLVSPRATYAEIAARPRWLGAFLTVVILSGAAATAFMATDVGQRAVLDQQITQAEASGRHLTDQQLQVIERIAPYYKYFALGIQVVFFGVGGLVVSGVAIGVFNALLGGDAGFKQVFSIVAHSGVVLMVGGLFSLPLAYARGTLTSPTSLAVFLPMLEDNTFLARMIGSFDLFRIWWAISLAIGLGVLYRKRTGPIAATLLIIYAVIAITYAGVVTALQGA